MRNPLRHWTAALAAAFLFAAASTGMAQTNSIYRVLQDSQPDSDWTLTIRRQEDRAPRGSNAKANSPPRLALRLSDNDLDEQERARDRERDRERDRDFFDEETEFDQPPEFSAAPAASSVQYYLERGRDFAYQVEVNTGESFPRRRWIGLPYFLTLYRTEDRNPAIAVCIGTLHCSIQTKEGQEWAPDPESNIQFPRYVAVHSTYAFGERALEKDRTTHFPAQVRMVLSPEDIMFPKVPAISNSPRNENRGQRSYQVRATYGTKKITGTYQQLNRIEFEDSDRPSIIRQYLFQCPDEDVMFGIRQVCTFNREDGLVDSANITFQAMWDGTHQLKVTANRLTGESMSKVRAVAAKQFSPSDLPAELHRRPAEGAAWLDLPRLNAATELIPGQRVICRAPFDELRLGGTRYYWARVIETLTTSDVLVQLDGSLETMELDYDNVHPQ